MEPRIADFGVSKLLTGDATEATSYETVHDVFTPGYDAPELRNARKYGPKSDVSLPPLPLSQTGRIHTFLLAFFPQSKGLSFRVCAHMCLLVPHPRRSTRWASFCFKSRQASPRSWRAASATCRPSCGPTSRRSSPRTS